eukprot:6062071-Pleurochrysis_carterae.AAC.1
MAASECGADAANGACAPSPAAAAPAQIARGCQASSGAKTEQGLKRANGAGSEAVVKVASASTRMNPVETPARQPSLVARKQRVTSPEKDNKEKGPSAREQRIAEVSMPDQAAGGKEGKRKPSAAERSMVETKLAGAVQTAAAEKSAGQVAAAEKAAEQQ